MPEEEQLTTFMTETGNKRPAAAFLDEHPEFRERMTASETFRELKKRDALPLLDGEQLYIYRGDAPGDEEDLYLDALARGSNSLTTDALARKLFLELDEPHRELISNRARRR
jgi:hypothetical protein